MPKLKKITGNHREVVNAIFSSLYISRHETVPNQMLKTVSYQDNMAAIFLDIPRTLFLASNGKTTEHFLHDWVNVSSNDFSQGNMAGNVYAIPLTLFLLSASFIKPGTERTEANRLNYYQSIKNITFAYYDDEGHLCGVSLSYVKQDPSLWVANIIRNTTNNAENREVLLLSSEELVDAEKGQLVEGNTAVKDFSDFLKSKAVKKVFAGAIRADGTLNTAKLAKLDKAQFDIAPIIGSTETITAKERQFKEWQAKQMQAIAAVKQQYVVEKTQVRERGGLDVGEQIATLKKIRDIKIAIINERFEPACRKAMLVPLALSLEKMETQSLITRNRTSFTVGLYAFAVLVCFILILTGYGAALGLTLVTELETYLALSDATVAAGLVVNSAINTRINERNLTSQLETYHQSDAGRTELAANLEKTFTIPEEEIQHRLLAQLALEKESVNEIKLGEELESSGFSEIENRLLEASDKKSPEEERTTRLVNSVSESFSNPKDSVVRPIIKNEDAVVSEIGRYQV